MALSRGDQRRKVVRGTGVACALLAAAGGLTLSADLVAATEFDGRYIGSIAHVDGLVGTPPNQMQHQLDLGARSTTPAGLDLNLRTTLRYLSELGGSSTDIFRSRFEGQLAAERWRLRGQFVPYQATAIGPRAPHERMGQLGLLLTPPRLPAMAVDYVRREHSTPSTYNRSDDLQAAATYSGRRGGGQMSYRRIDAETPGSFSTSSRIEEWRGEAHGTVGGRGFSANGEYELLVSDYMARARNRDLHTQRAAGNANWSPVRRITLGAGILERWGLNDDSAFDEPLDIRERFLDARAEYRPINGLQLEATREYRRTIAITGPVVSDYARFQADFRRDIYPLMNLQTGAARTQPIGSSQGELPLDTAYGILDGRLAYGLGGRGELRASRASEDGARGIYWRRLLQLRAVPRPSARAQLTWTRDTRPLALGFEQIDREWELVLGYTPRPVLTLSGSMRWLDGAGLVIRHDRFADFTGTWQAARRTNVTVQWSQRDGERGRAATAFTTTRETVTGVDLNLGIDPANRTQLSWRRLTSLATPTIQTYTLTFTSNF